MQGSSALTAPAVEGAFVFGAYNVAGTVNAGPAGSLRAGAHGASVGRFGWANEAGIVVNARASAADLIGIVIPQFGPGVDWRRVFYDEDSQSYKIREGMDMAMLARGNVWVRFPAGATPAQSVYANPLDGTAISGYSPDGELTRWSVVTPARPGGLAIISTWSMYG